MNLGSHTALSFSSTTTSVRDLRGLSLDTKRVDVMGLRQDFGQGESASALSLTLVPFLLGALLGLFRLFDPPERKAA